MYCLRNKFGTDWQTENQDKLEAVIDSLSKLAKMSVAECKCNVQFFRHNLFLNASHLDLERMTYKAQGENRCNFAFDLDSYIIEKLCREKQY